jgi:hypothetical protein
VQPGKIFNNLFMSVQEQYIAYYRRKQFAKLFRFLSQQDGLTGKYNDVHNF